jgi:asparagine synthase (glutamine-hydrolysing)
MCGIAGFVGPRNERLLRRMCATLTHRGPDAEGFYQDDYVGLAHRRLSIIDLLNGRQPMTNETGTLQLVFNGEIYNYQALTEELKRQGHTFATSSDTETILHLYEEHGLDFLRHLRGMFAIALWDSGKKRLVLARDRIGEKPLFYAANGGRLAFGSEIKAVLPWLESRSVNPRSICEFFALGYVPSPRTCFDEVRKLPAGHMLVHEKGQATVLQYWRRTVAGPAPSYEDACEEVAHLLRESIQLCLKSDVEVGAFLSGGLDSSLVVALMREANTRVQTFSVGYGSEADGFNELNYARLVAQKFSTRQHELILGAGSSLELLPRVLSHYDEPHGEPTSVLVYLLCQFTRKHLTVALGGTGGDELFFGYPRHAAIRWISLYNAVPKVLRRSVIESIVSRWPESTRGSRFAKRVKRFVEGAAGSEPETYLNWISLLNRDVRADMVSSEIRNRSEDPEGERFLRDYLCRPGDLYSAAADIDIEGYLPEYQLTYMDRMSMAHGLEVRSPLCDYRLVDFVSGLPAGYRVRNGRSKRILKDVSRRWLPDGIINRKKVGFDSPIGEWFKGELRSFLLRFLSEENVKNSGLLNPDAVTALVQSHLSGARDYSLQLWSIVAVEAWYRMFIEQKVEHQQIPRMTDIRGGSEAPVSTAVPPALAAL